MDVMVDRCAGVDVHRDEVVATARVPGVGRRRFEQETRTFKSTLGGLAQLGAWLAELGVTLVGMDPRACTERRCSRRSRSASSAGL